MVLLGQASALKHSWREQSSFFINLIVTDSSFWNLKVPFPQLMSGLIFLSHGRPRITASSPSPETRNWVQIFLSSTFNHKVVASVIVPFLFGVLLTFVTLMGFERAIVSNLCFFTKPSSMNTPPALESMRAFISTVLRSSVPMDAGKHIDSLSIVATSTEEMINSVVSDVVAGHFFKNPLLPWVPWQAACLLPLVQPSWPWFWHVSPCLGFCSG